TPIPREKSNRRLRSLGRDAAAWCTTPTDASKGCARAANSPPSSCRLPTDPRSPAGRRDVRSFDVLHLLAQPLDLFFDLDDSMGDFGAQCFRPDRVRFPVHLLQKKIQALA